MLKLKLLFSFLLISTFTFSQVFTGYGGLISDNGSKNFYSQTISGIAGSINSNFGVLGVTVNITHSYTSDLEIFLISPDNTVVELSTGNGGNGKNYDNCFFTNSSSSKITSVKAPFKGSYKPEGSLGVINNNQNPNGNWKLMVVDTKRNKDSGSLVNWNVIFSSNPSRLEPFVNSNLPLILVNTHGKNIVDDPRIFANMKIVSNEKGLNSVNDSNKFFSYGITIETRGSSSQSFPKKPYGFTTVLNNLADTNVSLLGLPSEHDWVLNATYNDKSLMRDVLAYELARRTGRYATRYRYCELFINGSYEGIYVLMEKVKRDKNRVDISKLVPKDSTGNDLTGGYILKIDKTTGNNNGGFSSNGVYFQYDYPNGPDMVKQQLAYIQNYITNFEAALAGSQFQDPTSGFRKYADASTFIDLSIMNEISKNVDGYRLSTYLFKDKDSKGGKLKMGPIWDFNLAWNNADYNNSSSPVGWEIDLSGGAPFWWKRFRADTAYVKDYYCRWNQLRQSTLSLYSINKFIDSTYKVLLDASYRNFSRWPVMGVYIWPNPSPLSYSMKEEVDSLKSWINYRFAWMDEELGVDCKKVNTCKPRVAVFAVKSATCKYQPIKLFADGVGETFKWTPSTGLNTTNGREVVATLSATTTYKVVMKTKAGCTDSTYITIKVLPLPPKTITGNTSICEGKSTDLSVPAGAKTYVWTPPVALDNFYGNKVKATPKYNITYKVAITDTMGCKDSAFVTVIVNKKPKITITADKDSICSQDSVELKATGAFIYKWQSAVGLKNATGSNTIVYPQNTKYTVIGTSDKGCIDSASYSIYDYPQSPLSITATSLQLCNGASTILTAKEGSNYTWKKTTDFNGSNSATIYITPREDTKYNVQALNKFGCLDSASISVGVYPELKLELSGNQTICVGQQTTLIATGLNNYVWSPSTGLNTSTASVVISSPKQSIIYKVIGTSVNLCHDTSEIEVKVNKLPILLLTTSSDTIVEGESATLNVSGAKNYLWTPNKWLSTNTGNSIVASPLTNTIYVVTGSDSNQCTQKDSISIMVKKKQVNAISSINHLEFKIYPNPASEFVMIESQSKAELTVSGLHGTEIFHTSISYGTNKINMLQLPAGVYIFSLKSEIGNRYYRVVKE